MNELVVIKKPELIILTEKRKLKYYKPAERLEIAKKLVKKITALLGTHDLTDESTMLVTIKFLCENEESFSPEEIEKAFQLAILGKIDVKLEKTYSARLHGAVMLAYVKYFKETTEAYKRQKRKQELDAIDTTKTLERSEKIALVINGIEECFEDVQEGNKIIEGRQWVADWLEEQKLVEPKIKEACFHAAMRKARIEMKRENTTEDDIYNRATVIQKYEIIKTVMKNFTTVDQLKAKCYRVDSYIQRNGHWL